MTLTPWVAQLTQFSLRLDRAERELKDIQSSLSPLLVPVRAQLRVAQSAWSRSFIGDFSYLYTPDMTPPTVEFDEEWGTTSAPGWRVWTWQEFVNWVETTTSVSMATVHALNSRATEIATTIGDETLLAMAPGRDLDRYRNDVKSLDDEIAKPLARSQQVIARSRLPSRSGPTTNYRELSRGVRIPHHIWLEAGLDASDEICQGALARLRLLKRATAGFVIRENALGHTADLAVLQRWLPAVRVFDRIARALAGLLPSRLASKLFDHPLARLVGLVADVGGAIALGVVVLKLVI